MNVKLFFICPFVFIHMQHFQPIFVSSIHSSIHHTPPLFSSIHFKPFFIFTYLFIHTNYFQLTFLLFIHFFIRLLCLIHQCIHVSQFKRKITLLSNYSSSSSSTSSSTSLLHPPIHPFTLHSVISLPHPYIHPFTLYTILHLYLYFHPYKTHPTHFSPPHPFPHPSLSHITHSPVSLSLHPEIRHSLHPGQTRPYGLCPDRLRQDSGLPRAHP